MKHFFIPSIWAVIVVFLVYLRRGECKMAAVYASGDGGIARGRGACPKQRVLGNI